MMYGSTIVFLDALRNLGFKKSAVHVAYAIENSALPFEMVDGALTYLMGDMSGFATCSECPYPVLSEDEKRHEECREDILNVIAQEEAAWNEHRANWTRERDEYDLARLLDSFCTEPGCYETATSSDNKCESHLYQYEEYDPEDDDCDGFCGQTRRTCSCHELLSLRRHDADPDTRGSGWTA